MNYWHVLASVKHRQSTGP